EQSPQPSLQGFLAALRARDVTIKRELNETGGGVRVMTVHGAKGLESPIVILADATAKSPGKSRPVILRADDEGPLLVHASAEGALVFPATDSPEAAGPAAEPAAPIAAIVPHLPPAPRLFPRPELLAPSRLGKDEAMLATAAERAADPAERDLARRRGVALHA